MRRFGAAQRLPVRPPFRLDLTVDALRRLASNVVDVVTPDGTFYRALHDAAGTEVVAVRQLAEDSVELRATGPHAERWLPTASRMLGVQTDLEQWYERSRRIVWLAPLTEVLRGLKPPRYPSLWEAFAHAILFQQISIHAAASIMRRSVELLGESVTAEGVRCLVFPPPERWLAAPDGSLRGAGISSNKIAHLRSAAAAITGATLIESELEALTSDEVAKRLCAVRGIGPWSASVVLLRGFGRLDAFPLRDSGVARALSLISGEMHVDQGGLLDRLGNVRGMLYYHLLLGRMRNLAPLRSAALNDDAV